jgi:hypothetical protein
MSDIVMKYTYTGWAGKTLKCVVCGSDSSRGGYETANPSNSIVFCEGCNSPLEVHGMKVRRVKTHRNLRRSLGGEKLDGSRNNSVAGKFGDPLCREPLHLVRHGSQHEYFELVRI